VSQSTRAVKGFSGAGGRGCGWETEKLGGQPDKDRDQPLGPPRSGAKKLETSTSSALASLTMVASDGLRCPRRICERWPLEKFVSR